MPRRSVSLKDYLAVIIALASLLISVIGAYYSHFYTKSELLFYARNIEIDERAAHKDSGSVDLLIECVLAIDQQDSQPLPREQASALEPGESRADDGYVSVHKNAQSSLLYKARSKVTVAVVVPSSSLRRKDE